MSQRGRGTVIAVLRRVTRGRLRLAAGLAVAVLAAVLPPLCLVPVIVGLAVYAWPHLDRSRHVLLRAGADIALSVLLGLDAVLILIAAANLLGLTPQQVAAARGAVERLKVAGDV